MRILVTGAAGFIGSAVSKYLLNQGHSVVGVDSLNDYYEVELKQSRLKDINATKNGKNFWFKEFGIENREAIGELFEKEKFDKVVHLAAQAGVRYSIENPHAYVDSNLVGFVNILEGCRHNDVKHLVYASSSSVYGANETMPFVESDNVDHPVSLYAATKKANELMAHTYSHLYNLPTTGLRFFTVYGPWGRPDMALFKFTKAILAGEEIPVYNYGDHYRDFTYIDDIVDGIVKALNHTAEPDATWTGKSPNPSTSKAPYRVFNIGAHEPVHLLSFIETLEEALGVEAKKQLLPMQAGDVPATYANVDALEKVTGYKPSVSIKEGIGNFVKWYKDYYGV